MKHVVAMAVLAVAVVVAAAGATAAASGRFGDDDGNVHESMIEAIAGAGVAAGCGPRLYCPAQEVSRAQMAAFLARALDLPPASADYFADDEDSPHQDAINRVAEAGIATGRSEGTFAPRDPVQRAEMAAFLTRAFELGPTDRDYFADDNGLVHEDAINRVATAGITRGCGGLNFCPSEPVHRDQMASFLGRALGLAPLTPGERVFEGNGNATVQLVKPDAGPVIAEISHVGSAAFVVAERHADGTRGNVLVDDRAGYHGIVLVDRPGGDEAETAGFDITADGSWRIVVRPVAEAIRFGVSASGFGGDAVVVYTGESGTARVTHDGPGRFVVWSHGDGVSDLVVDTVGPYDEVVPFPAGERIIEIRNSGTWSITPE
jgi:hypothetical protein